MKIIINPNNSEVENIKNNDYITKPKCIVCPTCKELSLIKVKDYIINIFGCKNLHNMNNITLDEFMKTQYIDNSKIICGQCNQNHKNNNDDFFRCIKCNINLCPTCKLSHDTKHDIINYSKKDYICNSHNEAYVKYCNDCKKNICILCANAHKDHICYNFENIIPNINIIKTKMNELKNQIYFLSNNIRTIVNKLNKISFNLKTFYDLYDNILNDYNIKDRNFESLHNINEINEINLDEITRINKEINLTNKFDLLMELYNKMSNSKEKLSKIFNITGNAAPKKVEGGVKKKNSVEQFFGISSQKTKTYNDGKYTGDIVNNCRHGKGTMVYNNGDKYEGEWKNDKFEGKGKFFYKNGDIYEGDWLNDKFDGTGFYTFKTGNSFFGSWKNGKREGRGVYLFNNGYKYDGEWKNGTMDGKGIFLSPNGDKYEGDYKNGNREGKGVYYYSNGDIYEGDWKNNKREGKGIYYYANGDREMGDYVNNLPIGKQVKLDKKGEVTIRN